MNNGMYCRDELFLRSLVCYIGNNFPRCFANRELNIKITRSWAHLKVRHSSLYIILHISPLWLGYVGLLQSFLNFQRKQLAVDIDSFM